MVSLPGVTGLASPTNRPQTAHGCQSVTMATTAAASADADKENVTDECEQRRHNISPDRTPHAGQLAAH